MKKFAEHWLDIGRRAKGPVIQSFVIYAFFLFFATCYSDAARELEDCDFHGWAGAMIPCW